VARAESHLLVVGGVAPCGGRRVPVTSTGCHRGGQALRLAGPCRPTSARRTTSSCASCDDWSPTCPSRWRWWAARSSAMPTVSPSRAATSCWAPRTAGPPWRSRDPVGGPGGARRGEQEPAVVARRMAGALAPAHRSSSTTRPSSTPRTSTSPSGSTLKGRCAARGRLGRCGAAHRQRTGAVGGRTRAERRGRRHLPVNTPSGPGPFDVLVLGSGVAGSRLRCASPSTAHTPLRRRVLTKGELSESATAGPRAGGGRPRRGRGLDRPALGRHPGRRAGSATSTRCACWSTRPARVNELIALGRSSTVSSR